MPNSVVPLSKAITVPMALLVQQVQWPENPPPQQWPPMPDTAGAVTRLRSLAEEGVLAQTVAAAGQAEKRWLTGAAFAVATPVVFERLTRVYEKRRGHRTCALGVHRLADGCLDRFHDDLEAVVADLLTATDTSIYNLEGWITRRLTAVTIDAYRRRRGARGALQRPRLPGWLSRRLDDDPWLGQLAVEILVWVGVPATAGTSLWPLDSWAERRGQITGDWAGSDAATVEREVEQVLAMMRHRAKWYTDHVEIPLGAKVPPLAPAYTYDGVTGPEFSALAAVQQHEIDDARLADLASLALAAIEARLAADGPLGSTVASVIQTVFGRLDGAEPAEMPHSATGDGGKISALISDPAELERVCGVVRDILADGVVAGRKNSGDLRK